MKLHTEMPQTCKQLNQLYFVLIHHVKVLYMYSGGHSLGINFWLTQIHFTPIARHIMYTYENMATLLIFHQGKVSKVATHEYIMLYKAAHNDCHLYASVVFCCVIEKEMKNDIQ